MLLIEVEIKNLYSKPHGHMAKESGIIWQNAAIEIA